MPANWKHPGMHVKQMPPKTPKNPKHSKASIRWGTPDGDSSKGHDIITRERAVLGGRIGFDPCSETVFNAVVKADEFLSWEERKEDGLLLPWKDVVHLNPPGGLVPEFWRKLFEEIEAGRVTQCIWVGFAMDQLNILASEEHHPSDFQLCYVRKRIPFNPHDRDDSTVDRPSHSNYICGLGTDWDRFVEQFGPIGKCQRGPLG